MQIHDQRSLATDAEVELIPDTLDEATLSGWLVSEPDDQGFVTVELLEVHTAEAQALVGDDLAVVQQTEGMDVTLTMRPGSLEMTETELDEAGFADLVEAVKVTYVRETDLVLPEDPDDDELLATAEPDAWEWVEIELKLDHEDLEQLTG